MRIYVFEIIEGARNGKFVKNQWFVKNGKNFTNDMFNILRSRVHTIKKSDINTLVSKKSVVVAEKNQKLSFHLKSGFITCNKQNEVAYTRGG